MALTEQERKLAKIIKDPVLWAEHTLKDPNTLNKPLKLRWPQIKVLRDPSIKVVMRFGRRIGKCESERASIITEQGPINIKKLLEMQNRPQILTFNEETQEIIKTQNYYIHENGIKPTFKITTKTGRVNYCTGNHPFLTIDPNGDLNWIEVDNMILGDKIAIPSTYEGLIDGEHMLAEKARLLGYLCGDGGTSQKTISFTNFDEAVVEDFEKIISLFNCSLKMAYLGNYRVAKCSGQKNMLAAFAREHKLMGKLATNKEVPEKIMFGTEKVIASFLAAYFDCDGWCSINRKIGKRNIPPIEIGACSSSEILARGVQHLLLRLGIVSRIKKKKVLYKEEYRFAWQVTIRDAKNILKFYSKIKLVSKKKYQLEKMLSIIESQVDTGNNSTYTIPNAIWTYIKRKKDEKGLTNKEVAGSISRSDNKRLRTKYSISRKKIIEYSHNLQDDYLRKLGTNNILWDPVVDIEYLGEEMTYDLSLPETHTFIADDIISHNTITLSVKMLHYAFTHANSVQILATPYESQIKVVFDQLSGFIYSSPQLKDSIKGSTKNPWEIVFKNGARIKGFTAGTKSGAEGGSLRGQKADIIYLDV